MKLIQIIYWMFMAALLGASIMAIADEPEDKPAYTIEKKTCRYHILGRDPDNMYIIYVIQECQIPVETIEDDHNGDIKT